MKWKLNRPTTPTDQERIKDLENRLDAAVAESRGLRAEMDELHRRNELRDVRKRLKQQSRLIGTDVTYSDDETIN